MYIDYGEVVLCLGVNYCVFGDRCVSASDRNKSNVGPFPCFCCGELFQIFFRGKHICPSGFSTTLYIPLCPFQNFQQSPSRNLLIFMSRYVKAIIIILYAGVMINIILVHTSLHRMVRSRVQRGLQLPCRLHMDFQLKRKSGIRKHHCS